VSTGRSLSSVCSDGDMPSPRTVYYWRGLRPDFARQLSTARLYQIERIADLMVEIALRVVDDRAGLDPRRAKVAA